MSESRSNSVISPRQIRSRTHSFSSDRPSTISHGLLSPPQSVSPEAAFIATTAASQIVTNDHDNHARTWYDQNDVEPADEIPVVSLGALELVNSFLDQLLFSFLQVAKSTSLTALRPAVSDILKPKLARDTIHNADEELREYLGGADEDEFDDPQSPNSRDWDVELVWKRTRLRCMVYSSLGDLEEDDEDRYMQQENLEVGADESSADTISPAVAIFLTSVLEYMGELTLTVAGQAAYNRVRAKIEKELKDGTRNITDRADPIVVEEMDMERVALDRTLGRLWRGWKKRLRSSVIDSVGQAFSRGSRHNSFVSDVHDQRSPTSDGVHDFKRIRDHVEKTIQEDIDPADIPLPLDPEDIPLPMGENDIEEIEVPGLARYSDDEEEVEEKEEFETRRVQSFIIARSPPVSGVRIPALPSSDDNLIGLHKRSFSLPTRRPLFYATARPRSTTANGEEEVTAAAAKTRKTTPKAKSGSDGDDSDNVDEVTFEKAEILTSSRVSVSSTSSRSVSESGRPAHIRRSSSVHSARIIDVPAPRSPVSSRAPSLDASERQRPGSVTSPSSLAQSTHIDDSRKAKSMDPVSRVGAGVSGTRSPVERMRPSIQNATTISESEEEVDDQAAKTGVVGYGVASSRTRDYSGTVPLGLKTNVKVSDKALPSPKAEQIQTLPKGAGAKLSNSSVPYGDEPPEVPRKSSTHLSRQAPKTEPKGLPAVERTRSREADDETSLGPNVGIPPRPIHTSGSSTSSVTGRLKAVRSSDDSSSRAESMARNFEELIQSNQTITYTLTPENMRDIDVKPPLDGPVVTKISRKSEDTRMPSADVSGSPTGQRATPAVAQVPAETKAKPSGPIPRAPAGMAVAMGRVGGPQAREARVAGESLADFAEFIKSTGPPGDRGPPSLRSVQVPSSPSKKSLDRRVSVTSNRSWNRNRYQPREAAVDRRADNSDLIDFIRQGPPAASSNGQHRIPRHVAPFRNTMDSDMMSGAVGGKAVDAVIPEIRYSQTSTNFTENSMPSIQSSVNSSSALLKNKGSSKASKLLGEDEGMPVRKTRRVQDPYAIDFSDEEDGFEELPRAAPPKKEESLAEFLRNYEPPPEPASQSSFKKPKKKSSAPSLIGRFSRKDSKDALAHADARPLNSRASSTALNGPDSRSLNSRTGTGTARKHIPLQVHIPPGYDKYGPTSTSTNTPMSTNSARRPMPPVGRVPMKKFEPREPVASGRTSDLAAFLRDSQPPQIDKALPDMPPQSEDSSGFSKLFGRKKTSVV